jgi:hypothetical protein
MGVGSYLFSSESVTEGHPDKVADGSRSSISRGLRMFGHYRLGSSGRRDYH